MQADQGTWGLFSRSRTIRTLPNGTLTLLSLVAGRVQSIDQRPASSTAGPRNFPRWIWSLCAYTLKSWIDGQGKMADEK